MYIIILLFNMKKIRDDKVKNLILNMRESAEFIVDLINYTCHFVNMNKINIFLFLMYEIVAPSNPAN